MFASRLGFEAGSSFMKKLALDFSENKLHIRFAFSGNMNLLRRTN
jgi:hypothetical protein